MKYQALFSSKDKNKKLKCRLLQFLFGALRLNSKFTISVSILCVANLITSHSIPVFWMRSSLLALRVGCRI